jgi:hypothetical protein
MTQYHQDDMSITRSSTSNTQPSSVYMFPAPSLSTILDEQFVITHTATTTALHSTPTSSIMKSICSMEDHASSSTTKNNARAGSQRYHRRHQRRRKTRLESVLDQIDGICTEKECENFMTSRSYPRGVYIRQKQQQQQRVSLSLSSATATSTETIKKEDRSSSSPESVGVPFELVVAEQAFQYFEEVDDVESTNRMAGTTVVKNCYYDQQQQSSCGEKRRNRGSDSAFSSASSRQLPQRYSKYTKV